MNNVLHNLPPQKNYLESESCGDMEGATTFVEVSKGESLNTNAISMQVLIASNFLPENYKVYSMGRDVETSSEPVYFTVLKGNRSAISATTTPVPSSLVIPVQTTQVGMMTMQTTTNVPTQHGLTLSTVLISLGLVSVYIVLKNKMV